MGWNIDPSGMTELLPTSAPRLPGPAADDHRERRRVLRRGRRADGRVHDADRIAYLHRHIDAVGEAIDAGVDVRGYFLWSLLDNFEWSWGYDRRFGIIRVDYDTLRADAQGLRPLVRRADPHQLAAAGGPDPGLAGGRIERRIAGGPIRLRRRPRRGTTPRPPSGSPSRRPAPRSCHRPW